MAGKIRGNVSARDARLIVGSTKIYKLLDMPIKVCLFFRWIIISFYIKMSQVVR